MSEILKAYLKHEAALRRYLSKYSASREDVEDLVQETFIKGFAAETRTEIAEPKRFLYRIARNLAVSRFRKEKAAPTEATADLGGDCVVIDESLVDAEALLDSRRKLMLLAEAVASLPPQCRKAFLMRRVEGLAFKQIAVRMNLSLSAVEKYVKTGLLKCNAYLRERGYEPSEFGAAHLADNNAPTRSASEEEPN